MNNCTIAAYDFGCFNSCNDVETPLLAASTATYSIEYYRRGHFVTSDISVDSGQPIEIPPYVFNEYGVVIFKIKDENGDYIAFEETVDDVTTQYDCFKLTMNPYVEITA